MAVQEGGRTGGRFVRLGQGLCGCHVTGLDAAGQVVPLPVQLDAGIRMRGNAQRQHRAGGLGKLKGAVPAGHRQLVAQEGVIAGEELLLLGGRHRDGLGGGKVPYHRSDGCRERREREVRLVVAAPAGDPVRGVTEKEHVPGIEDAPVEAERGGQGEIGLLPPDVKRHLGRRL